jgi:outer membrane protein assembly factor BamD (BamD/ComL family)
MKSGNSEENIAVKNNGKINSSDTQSLISISNQSYVYYKLVIKYYKNIHPNQFYKRNTDKTYVPKTYDEQLKILHTIYISFNSAEYYFKKVITEYPTSEWAHDARDKIELLKKLYKSYENTDVEKYNQIIDSTGFIHEIGLKMMK